MLKKKKKKRLALSALHLCLSTIESSGFIVNKTREIWRFVFQVGPLGPI